MWLPFGEADGYGTPTDTSKPNCSGLSVIFPGISSDQHQTGKQFRHIAKIDSMFGDVRSSFFLVPFESYEKSVNTVCMYVKAGMTRGIVRACREWVRVV